MKSPKICGIYRIKNLINGKSMIGQSKDIKNRWGGHIHLLRMNKHQNVYLQNSWNKHGEKNFKFEIILLCSLENLNKEEIRLIKENKTCNRLFGYNIAEGGDRPTVTKESREKTRKAKLGKNLSAEHIQKIKESHPRGKNHPYYGKRLSKEHREKISASEKGKIIPQEVRDKISKSHTGRHVGKDNNMYGKKVSDKAKAIISEKSRLRNSGSGNPMYGKKMSEAHRQKIREGWNRWRSRQLSNA